MSEKSSKKRQKSLSPSPDRKISNERPKDEPPLKKFKENQLNDPNESFNEPSSKKSTNSQKTSRNSSNSKILTINPLKGGIYIPPFRLAQYQNQINDKSSIEYQQITWDALRKSINGLINKVNVSNIMHIIPELINENIIRGRGLLCQSIMKAQSASPTFTRVYAALISVINAKLPQIGELLLSRLIIQFKKSFKRNDKTQMLSSSRFIAHLFNQQLAGEIIILQISALLLEKPTDDLVEVSVEFMKESGAVLQSQSPQGFYGVFERLRGILHEGEISKRVQYIIEDLFAIRKSQFKNFPGVIQDLELIDYDDQVTHEDLSLDEDEENLLDIGEKLNYFRADEEFEENEKKYLAIKTALLADFDLTPEDLVKKDDESDNDDNENERKKRGKEIDNEEDEEEEDDDEDNEEKQEIIDTTEKNLVALRRTIYLTIMSSLDFEECCHKMLKQNIQSGDEIEICKMIIECCCQERTFMRFYGLLAQRFCMIDRIYQSNLEGCFKEQYQFIHRLETNKLRNVAKFFAHLLHTDAINWSALECIHLNEEETTSSSRIFIKILFQELAEAFGLEKLNLRLQNVTLSHYFNGIFPKDHPKNVRFAINFFTSIGLGGLTEKLREFLRTMPQLILQNNNNNNDVSSSDDSSSDSSSDSDSSSSDSSDSDSSDSSDSSNSDSSSSDSSDSDSSDSEDDKRRRRKKIISSKDREKEKDKEKEKEKRKVSPKGKKSLSRDRERERSRGKENDREKDRVRGERSRKSRENSSSPSRSRSPLPRHPLNRSSDKSKFNSIDRKKFDEKDERKDEQKNIRKEDKREDKREEGDKEVKDDKMKEEIRRRDDRDRSRERYRRRDDRDRSIERRRDRDRDYGRERGSGGRYRDSDRDRNRDRERDNRQFDRDNNRDNRGYRSHRDSERGDRDSGRDRDNHNRGSHRGRDRGSDRDSGRDNEKREGNRDSGRDRDNNRDRDRSDRDSGKDKEREKDIQNNFSTDKVDDDLNF